jgi:predicted nucleic acid-binding protein
VRQLSYYIDTSVWNFLLEEDRPEHRAVTERFFAQNRQFGTLAISDVVLEEIQRASGPRRAALQQLISRHQPILLQRTEEADELANRYVEAGLIPVRYRNDALHLAVAVIHDMDVVVSWNFEHLVRLTTRLGVNGLNKMLGYRDIEIVSPEEVVS